MPPFCTAPSPPFSLVARAPPAHGHRQCLCADCQSLARFSDAGPDPCGATAGNERHERPLRYRGLEESRSLGGYEKALIPELKIRLPTFGRVQFVGGSACFYSVTRRRRLPSGEGGGRSQGEKKVLGTRRDFRTR